MSEPQIFIAGQPRRGRPPRAGVRATERIEFVVTASEHADLRGVAADEGEPVASVIRRAVDEFVADYRERRVFLSSTKTYRPE